jgi:purine-nucleoside phosphorylase
MFEKLASAAEFIQSLSSSTPKIGIELGSGLGNFIDHVQSPITIPYSDIPFFTPTIVEGHEGRLILGKLDGVDVAILHGKLHAYEGLSMEEIVFPIRTLATLGIESLILTNAAGGVNPNFTPGDLVIIQDHINLIGQNPLVGHSVKEFNPTLPNMGTIYHPGIQEIIHTLAKELNLDIKQGTYAAMLGPTYETKAEVKMLQVIGADMVGMSIVPEAIAAAHLGINVSGISCITNMANGITNHTMNAKPEILQKKAREVMDNFSKLLVKTVMTLGANHE